MNYLELLNLSREPFSNSPDPDSYYGTPMHDLCMTQLEIAIRLRRGMNVVLGMVGTGKSTLARRLLRSLDSSPGMESYLLLDAGSQSASAFRSKLAGLMGGDEKAAAREDGMAVLEELIYHKALDEGKNIVLIIDEGQKLSQDSMEILRELLNFETNTEKLLQIIIFAQPEFKQSIDAAPNFHDRINALSFLLPLNSRDASNLMQHRLRMAGGERAARLFSSGALKVLCHASGGRPRQLMRLGHHCLLALIMSGKTQVSASLAKTVARRECSISDIPPSFPWHAFLGTLIALLLLAALPHTAGDIAPVSFLPLPSSPSSAEHEAAPLSALPSIEKEKPMPAPSLGTVLTSESAKKLALICYGTEEAEPLLLAANPEWDGASEAEVTLPLLEYPVPERYTKNFLLSLASYPSAGEALAAMEHFSIVKPRFLARKQADGSLIFHITAPASFSMAGRAYGWMSGRPVPSDARTELLPPYGQGEKALYALPR